MINIRDRVLYRKYDNTWRSGILIRKRKARVYNYSLGNYDNSQNFRILTDIDTKQGIKIVQCHETRVIPYDENLVNTTYDNNS